MENFQVKLKNAPNTNAKIQIFAPRVHEHDSEYVPIQDRKSFATTLGLRYFTKIETDIIKNQESTFTHFYVFGCGYPANGLAKKMRNSQTEAAYDSMGSTFRACSFYPACRDISPSATNISVHSYKAFHPACRNEFEILFISASETCTFQSLSATIG